MASTGPRPISQAEHQRRWRRVKRIALKYGFVGRVEYQHVFSGAGGAQFGLAAEPGQDVLTVFAEAFIRDADSEDFSLEAIIAHERGHQVACRNEALQRFLVGKVVPSTEEILASLIASWLVPTENDRQHLVLKALGEALDCGLDLPEATHMIVELRAVLETVR